MLISWRIVIGRYGEETGDLTGAGVNNHFAGWRWSNWGGRGATNGTGGFPFVAFHSLLTLL